MVKKIKKWDFDGYSLKYKFNLIEPKYSIIAVGDIMGARDVATVINTRGPDILFKNIGKILKSGDISFCNLETPITESNARSEFSRSNFKTSPNVLPVISKYFDIVSCANNHIYDYQDLGAADTKKYLDANNIRSVGIGKTLTEARKPAIFELGQNIKIGFLAYTGLAYDIVYAEKYSVAPLKEEIIKEDMAKLKNKVDFCIVSMHFGYELVDYVLPIYRKIAKFTVDCGADIIIGHHPHVINGIEIYNDKIIAYSLGNFIFDNPIIPKKRDSMILKIGIGNDANICNLEVIPIYINDEYTPIIPEKITKKRIIDRFINLTESLKSDENDRLFWECASNSFIHNGFENIGKTIKKAGLKGFILMVKRLKPYHFLLLFKSVFKIKQ